MPRWPFTFASPKNKHDLGPWNTAILHYLQLKQIFDVVPELPRSKAKYDDHWTVSYFDQFVRLKLYLDANLLDKNSKIWKELQEADPGFRKIRHIYLFAVYGSDVKANGFPEEWKDEKWFAEWVHVNLMSKLKILDERTLKKGTDVILKTDYVDKWVAQEKIHKDNLEKRRRAGMTKEELALEAKQNKWEKSLAKDVKELMAKTQRKMIENAKKIKESLDREEHAKGQTERYLNLSNAHSKLIEPDVTIKTTEIFERAQYAYDQAASWQEKGKEEKEKQDKLQREQDELLGELKHYESYLMET
ncbi:hypothetical protein CEP54_002584 [Fusarium duplospermum]|uniref:Uncharacterized protein n=1 Tax=Fusarium duplospermum TaxID=1325734 RepID=A0A428QU98_9HYPO|nr:hypothetical protein CEP54_002584 [Fusarium duplospermum]